jgi:hypothetical protein
MHAQEPQLCVPVPEWCRVGVSVVMQVRRVEDERAAAGQTVFRYQAFVHICKVNTHIHIHI